MEAITITAAQASVDVMIHGGSVIDVVYAHLQQTQVVRPTCSFVPQHLAPFQHICLCKSSSLMSEM